MARHYLDHASTTPIRPEARAAIAGWEHDGVAADPGRVHTEGRMVRAALEAARDQVAGLFGVRPRQVVFTSGGTEAVNAAVWGVSSPGRGPILCADVEHSAVREASARSGPLVPIEVDSFGRLGDVEDAFGRCRSVHGTDPVLVHCQWANHEVGTVQPVSDVVELCRSRHTLVHVDAAAAAGHLPIDLAETGADLVSVSAHKLGGPAGSGALILRRGLRIDPLLVGGEQERARRAGFENVLAAVGFGAAAAALSSAGSLQAEAAVARSLTDRLTESATAVDGVRVFGDPVDRVPHIVCLGVDGVEAEPVLLGLDQSGIAVHSGSSCSSEALEPSPVLEAMGVDGERSLRLSVGWPSTETDVDAFESAFGPVVEGLRALRNG
ncbi:MAG TPA: cysteine desulfurase family protein [Acidimicrobiales bacterium]|nr:cysteine desulfurase family protein [Acidimicrobiales bacterium]